MQSIPFIKMHGAGNDYVFVDGFTSPLPANPERFARSVSDRRAGIGSDGLILIVPPTDGISDVEMQMWNSDGSQGAMCGNGVRCIALWMALRNRVDKLCRIATASRTVEVSIIEIERRHQRGNFRVNMGQPETPQSSHPLSKYLEVQLDTVTDPLSYEFTSVSMGNPHAVIFSEELSDFEVCTVGAAIECHSAFPDGVNIEWVRIRDENHLDVRVWERGSGETMACGTGACAVAVASVLHGKCGREHPIQIEMQGGRLTVEWEESGDVQMTGPAVVAFTGLWPGGG